MLVALLAAAPFVQAQPGMSQSTEKKITVTSDIRYRDGQSQAWLLDLAEPEQLPGGGLRPAIVIVHGGGWAFGSKSDQVYRDLLISYALQGYVTISVEYRFVQEAPLPACIEDVKCAVRWLKAHADKRAVDGCRNGYRPRHDGEQLLEREDEELPELGLVLDAVGEFHKSPPFNNLFPVFWGTDSKGGAPRHKKTA